MEDIQQKQGEIITDLTIRISGLERLLIKKNIITDEEFMGALGEIRDEIMKLVSEAINAQQKG
jgi:hypothetical protein